MLGRQYRVRLYDEIRGRVWVVGKRSEDITSVVDPGSGCGINQVSGYVSGSRRAKMTHKNRKKYEISCFEVLAGCSLLRAEGCSCVLDVLYGGLAIDK